MGHFSKTELNITHFYTNPKFLLALWKDLTEPNQKKVGLLKKTVLFGEVMWGVVPAPDGTIYLVDINETHYWGSF